MTTNGPQGMKGLLTVRTVGIPCGILIMAYILVFIMAYVADT